MKIKTARYLTSSVTVDNCPKPDRPEYAFIGRSNVGKSSLINMLTGIKGLAKISSTPGKTQSINHFVINDSWYLADLPGYGYAKQPKKIRKVFSKMINEYLLNRTNLLITFLLIDIRHSPLKADKEIIEWFGKNKLPFVLLFTKADKLNDSKIKQNIIIYRDYLLKNWSDLPFSIITSSKKFTGKKEILTFIDQTNKSFDPF